MIFLVKYEFFGKVQKFRTLTKNSYFAEIFILYDFHTLPKKFVLYQKIHTLLKYSYLTNNFEHKMCSCKLPFRETKTVLFLDHFPILYFTMKDVMSKREKLQFISTSINEHQIAPMMVYYQLNPFSTLSVPGLGFEEANMGGDNHVLFARWQTGKVIRWLGGPGQKNCIVYALQFFLLLSQ